MGQCSYDTVGNKCDLNDACVISMEAAEEVAQQLKVEYFEMSTKDNIINCRRSTLW